MPLKPFTKISFIPDYSRFDMDGLTDDMIDIIQTNNFKIILVSAWMVRVLFLAEYMNSNYVSICYTAIFGNPL